MRATHGTVALALVLCAFAAAGQDSAAARLLCVLPPAELGPADAAAGSPAAAIARMVEIAASAGGFEVLPQSAWSAAAAGVPAPELARGPAALRVAAGAGADLAVAGFLRREAGGRVLVRLRGYDVKGGRIVASVSARSRSGLALVNDTQQAVDLLIRALQALPPPLPERSGDGPGESLQVTLLSPDEGASVHLFAEEPVGRVTAGIAVLTLPRGAAVPVELRKPGYHSARIVAGAQPEQEVPALVRETWWGAGALVTADRLLGGGIMARRYLRPDLVYAGIEEYFYKPFPDDRGRGLRNDLRAVAGLELSSGPGSTARVAAAAGLGLEVLNLAGDEPLLFDLYVNALTVGLELSLPRWLAFVRVEARYSLPLSEEEWAGTWRTWSPPDSPDWKLPSLTLGVMRKMS